MLDQLNAGFPHVENMTGPQARAAVAQRRAPVNNVDDVRNTVDTSVPGSDGAIPVRIYYPHGASTDDLPGIVFCHGGGFVFCDIESHDGFCRALARGSGAVVVSVDYRLAPEHRAPAAVLDAFTAFCWVAEHGADLGIDPTRIAIAGDSAGGNLAAVTAILCRDRAVTAPAAQLLLYPAIDPSCDTDSYRRYGTGYFNTRAAMQWYWRQYLGGAEGFAPPYLVAPARADSHAGLPPAVIITARPRSVAQRRVRLRAATERRRSARHASRLRQVVPRLHDDPILRSGGKSTRPGMRRPAGAARRQKELTQWRQSSNYCASVDTTTHQGSRTGIGFGPGENTLPRPKPRRPP